MSGVRGLMAAALCAVLLPISTGAQSAARPQSTTAAQVTAHVSGFHDAATQLDLEQRFMAVPDRASAREHLRILTAAPHMAGTVEDRQTAEYVARKFREAGLETEIRAYRVWMNTPAEISVDVVAPAGVHMHGPSPERVAGDPFQDDP